MIQLSIIILSYNTKALLQSCLKSISQNLKDFEYEIIVVDNASGDESAEMVRREFKNVKVIENKKNVGFGAGCNIGAKTARGEHLLFLNSDTEIIDNSVKDAVHYLDENKKVAIIGGKLENLDTSIQRSFGKFYTVGNVFLMLFGREKTEMLFQSQDKIQEVDWVSGACMFIRKTIFEKLGGFDEKIFMYTEDMELCYRVKQSEYSVVFYPNTVVKHLNQGSSNRSFAIVNIYKNLPYFYKKHKSAVEYYIVKSMLFVKAEISIGIGILTNNNYLKETYEKALKY